MNIDMFWRKTVFFRDGKISICHILCVVVFFLLGFQAPASAKTTTLVVQSLAIEPYDQATNGFHSAFSSKVKKIVLSKDNKIKLRKKIIHEKPDFIYTVGLNALYSVKVDNLNHIPIISTMVPRSELQEMREKGNITGVAINHSAEDLISIILDVLPETENIFIPNSPGNTGLSLDEFKNVDVGGNVKIIDIAVTSPKEYLSVLSELKVKKNSVYLMLPDVGIINTVNMEALLLFSVEKQIPIVTFSEKYLPIGAFMSIGFDPYDVGVQAGELAQKLEEKRRIVKEALKTYNMDPLYARKAIVTVNKKIVDKMKLKINTKLRSNLIFVD